MTNLTRARLMCGAGSALGFAGMGISNFHWPTVLVPAEGFITAGGFGLMLLGVRGVRRALKDRQIDAALEGELAE